MKAISTGATIATFALLVNGCGTIGSLCRSPDGNEAKYFHVREMYGGTQFDYTELHRPMPEMFRIPGDYLVRDLVVGTDLMFCMVLDTVAIPYTYGRTQVQNQKKDNAEPTAAASPSVGRQKVNGQ